MLIQFSVIIGFSTLFIASIFDVRSQKGDVPVSVLLLGIILGILLHAIHSVSSGNFQPLIVTTLGGLGFTLYGFTSYILDMWGGADMLGISIIGFSTTYYLIQSNGLFGILNLFINMVAVAFIYALLFGGLKGIRSEEVRRDFGEKFRSNRFKIIIFAILGAFIPILISPIKGIVLFLFYEFMLIIYLFFRSLEEKAMTQEIDVEELEVGDVVSFEDIKLESWKEKNLVGVAIDKIKGSVSGRKEEEMLSKVEKKYGYSEIVGLTDEGLEKIKDSNVERVSVKEGIRFMPVFPVSLALTVAGFSVLEYIIIGL
jgi:hypothetical protein